MARYDWNRPPRRERGYDRGYGAARYGRRDSGYYGGPSHYWGPGLEGRPRGAQGPRYDEGFRGRNPAGEPRSSAGRMPDWRWSYPPRETRALGRGPDGRPRYDRGWR